jgi:hypothetical protein
LIVWDSLVVLFLLFDGITKVMQVAPVVQASARLGLPETLAPSIGIILLVCTLIYVLPPSSILGAVLLTAYLGGAVAINLRAGDPAFETLFPVIVGVLAWGGLFLRGDRLRMLLPLRARE